jgi:pimeloyl-ACP methyl ester carboxylesterase
MALYDERTYTSKDGLTLYYRAYGRPDALGVPLVCLPGLTRTSRDFEDIAEAVCDERPVLCPDLRGRGKSAYDPNYNNYSVVVELEDVIHMMDQESVAGTVFLGTSRGGIITMLMASMHPERLQGAILNDVGPEVSPEGLARISSYVGKTATPASWQDAARMMKEVSQSQYPTLTDPEWERYARRVFRDEDGKPEYDYDLKIGDTLRAEPPGDMWPLFRSLKPIPILVLRGECSDILSAETVEKMKAEKPDLEAVVVKERGHVPLLNEPEAESAILSFLARADRMVTRTVSPA